MIAALSLALGLLLAPIGQTPAPAAPAPVPGAPAAATERTRPPLSPAMAQARVEMRKACIDDYHRLCPVAFRGDRLSHQACIRSKRDEMSPQCKTAREHMRDMRRAERRGGDEARSGAAPVR